MATTNSGWGRGRVAASDKGEDAILRKPNGCAAFGCTLRGTSDSGGGWLCIAHSSSDASQWQGVTKAIHEHRWLVEYLDEVHRALPGLAWRERAHAFWHGCEDFMPPHPDENLLQYRQRMMGEFLWRIGVGHKRPAYAPRPQIVPKVHLSGGIAEVAGALREAVQRGRDRAAAREHAERHA